MGNSQQAKRSERIAIVATSTSSIVRVRADLILTFGRHGHRVLCITPQGPGKEMRTLKELNAQHKAIAFEPLSFEVPFLTDWKVQSDMGEIIRGWEPTIVLAFGLKPLVPAVLASRQAGIRSIVSFVTGVPPEERAWGSVKRLKQAFAESKAIVFHNKDDEATLKAKGILPPGAKTQILPGAGVDLRRFQVMLMPAHEAGLTFLMLSRLEAVRGVLDYAAAARGLKERHPTCQCLLAGPAGFGAGAVSAEQLQEVSGGALRYLGDLDDVRQALADAHVVVYPAQGGEGMPRAILEALATGRPVITTDTAGCRETVDEFVSGWRVQPRDQSALLEAMASYVKRPEMLEQALRASRQKAERLYDTDGVNAAVMALLKL